MSTPKSNLWSLSLVDESIRQVAELFQRVFSLNLQVSPSGRSFQATGFADSSQGVIAVSGELAENDAVIDVKIELARVPNPIRVPADQLFRSLSALSDRTRPVYLVDDDNSTMGVTLQVEAKPMSLIRANAFIAELNKIAVLANTLQLHLPQPLSSHDLSKQYERFNEYLEPVHPWQVNDPVSDGITKWADETFEFLFAGHSSVAIAAPLVLLQNLALQLVAQAGQRYNKSLACLIPPAVNARGLLELARHAPGIVVVPAMRLSLGTSPYEMGNEMQALLAALSSLGKPVVFTGSYAQLQTVFHGGQGGVSDPLMPIVRTVPELHLELLARFAVRSAGQVAGGLPAVVENELTNETLESLAPQSPAQQQRLLPQIAHHLVNAWTNGRPTTSSNTAFVTRISEQRETLAGLSDRSRAVRSSDVQERFSRTLTDSELSSFLQEQLLGQDEALARLVERLRMECLTRPLHQPIRYCAQGTPATGKSESAALLALRLKIPYVNIDAASLPDFHTAAAQLLGSGRGIVGSHQSGRLEQAAKHHAGALIEVSDLDHATPQVRSALADLFLQVLETGEAQSATGAMFSCANLIFAFTMNLPDGMDEAVRKSGLGFNQSLSEEAIQARVVTEIKKHLSSAFLSRIGTPVLFAPLAGEALATIIERAISAALKTAAERLQMVIADIVIKPGTGESIMTRLQTKLTSFGARALLEQGRALAASALLEFHQRNSKLKAPKLLISARPDGGLLIEAAALRK